MDEGDEMETHRVFGLVVAYAHVLPNQDPEYLDLDPSIVDTARAGIAELANAGDPAEVWERAANDLAMLAGSLIQNLAVERGVTVQQELDRMGFGR